ncbi:MAG: hypothetical protein Q4F83_13020 [Eubacteriales bacterium]|nr:hypothetical protein [Eubacteriales bacterium]
MKDNFLFAAVMMQEDTCRLFLEMALGFAIERVEVGYEKSSVYHPEYKGIIIVRYKAEVCIGIVVGTGRDTGIFADRYHGILASHLL